jgi:hypothetical protein
VSYPLTIILAWCFLVRDFHIPFTIDPVTKVFLVSIFICAIHLLYRKIEVQVNIKIIDMIWFLGACALLVFMNRNTITAGLAGDELYHSDLSSLGLKIIEMAAQKFPGWSWLSTRPVPEIVSYSNLLFIGIALVVLNIWNLASSKLPFGAKTFLLFLALVGVGYLCLSLPSRIEMHPPLRLLPLFLSQLIFGFDDLSFRLAGLSLFAALLAYLGTWVSQRTSSVLAGILVILSIVSIPAVSHVVGIVEPSIWALCCWIGSFLILDPNLVPRNDLDKHERLVKCGLWIGCASLARQTSIVLWPMVMIYLFVWKCSWRTWILALFPGAFMLPVLYTIRQFNHPASSNASLLNVWQSLVSGVGPLALLNSMTPVWIVIFLALFINLIIKSREHKIWPFLWSFIPSYCLYFSIWEYLWGLGRYHAEFLGGLTSIMLVSVIIRGHPKLFLKAIFPVLMLFIYSSFTMSTLNQDVSYGIWPKRRITTESVYPYRESLGFLKRQDTMGKFVFLGAVPVYGEFFLYLRGFSYAEISAFRSMQQNFEKELDKIETIIDLKATLARLGASWIVVQFGEKREKQHRNSTHEKIYRILGENKKMLDHLPYTFIGSYEGAIDLYPLEKRAGY